jgi:hypothetical protein
MNALCRFLACGALCLLAALAQAQEGGHDVDARQGPDAQRHHPSQDQTLHETFYSKWHMPDNPSASCCNEADCYPTEIKFVDGKIYAKRREDGKYIPVPPEKVERNRDNPDGRNHLCAPPPSASHSSDTVYCFALGGSS